MLELRFEAPIGYTIARHAKLRRHCLGSRMNFKARHEHLDGPGILVYQEVPHVLLAP